jgi:hypothetical protein
MQINPQAMVFVAFLCTGAICCAILGNGPGAFAFLMILGAYIVLS